MTDAPDLPGGDGVRPVGEVAADEDLSRRFVGGGLVTLLAQGARFALVLGSTAVLARILTKEDFGLVAGALAVIGFADSVKDLGLSMSTVQRDRVSHAQVSTLFWINAGFGVLLTLLLVAAAPLVAWFFREPRLAALTAVLAATVLLGSLSVQHHALLRREMRFGALAVLEVAALLAGVAAAIAAAVAGAGYWSLALMQVTIAAAFLLGVLRISSFRPSRPSRGAGVRPMLGYGAYLSAKGVVQHSARALDRLLIGRFCGAVSLGLYSKAGQLLLLPARQLNIPLTGVAVPTLSRAQGDPERYRKLYDETVRIPVLFGMPLVAFLFVVAREVVRLVLGPGWGGAVPIFRALAPAAWLATFTVGTSWVYLSLGHTKRQFQWILVSSASNVVAFLVGISWGAVGVALAFSIVTAAIRLPTVLFCFRGTPLRLVHLARAIWRPAVASLAAAVPLALLRPIAWPGAPLAIGLVLDGLLYGAAYAAVWLLLPEGRAILGETLGHLRRLLRSSN